MNRAQRRTLERQVAKMKRRAMNVPDSVTLRGGPMDGWAVKPGAPALQPDWRPKYLREEARQVYELTRATKAEEGQVPIESIPAWEDLSGAQQQHYIGIVRESRGDGHYELAEPDAAGLRHADWRPA